MATELKGRKVRELIGPVTIKNRIRKNQKKAFWVGAFYWLAILILFVLSFLRNTPKRVMHTPLSSEAPLMMEESTASTAAEAVLRVAPGPMFR